MLNISLTCFKKFFSLPQKTKKVQAHTHKLFALTTLKQTRVQFPRQELVLLLSHFKKIRFGLFYLFYHSAIPDSPTPFCLFLLTLISRSSWERVEASCVFKFVVLFLCCFLVPPLPSDIFPIPGPITYSVHGPCVNVWKRCFTLCTCQWQREET